MKKSFKYISIEGTLKSRGEYSTNSTEYRNYEAVTIVDKDGEEVHFHVLSISKRIDESIKYNTPMTFYILRQRAGDKMIGILYALESDNVKYYYPDTAIPILKSFAYQASFRSQIIADPYMRVGAIGLGGSALSAACYFASGIHPYAAMALGFGATIMYIAIPMFNKEKAAGISEMKEILQASGFDVNLKTNSKY